MQHAVLTIKSEIMGSNLLAGWFVHVTGCMNTSLRDYWSLWRRKQEAETRYLRRHDAVFNRTASTELGKQITPRETNRSSD